MSQARQMPRSLTGSLEHFRCQWVKVAPYCLALSLSLAFRILGSVAEKLLLQIGQSFISQQSGTQMASIFVAMAM